MFDLTYFNSLFLLNSLCLESQYIKISVRVNFNFFMSRYDSIEFESFLKVCYIIIHMDSQTVNQSACEPIINILCQPTQSEEEEALKQVENITLALQALRLQAFGKQDMQKVEELKENIQMFEKRIRSNREIPASPVAVQIHTNKIEVEPIIEFSPILAEDSSVSEEVSPPLHEAHIVVVSSPIRVPKSMRPTPMRSPPKGPMVQKSETVQIPADQAMSLLYPKNDMMAELRKMQQELLELKKKYGELNEKTDKLQERVSKLQCQMLTKAEFQKYQNQAKQKYTFFEGKFKILEQNDQKLKVYIDDKLKTKLKPTDNFTKKMEQLSEKNNRMYLYGNKIYWSLMNQVLAFRALSTGMVSQGKLPGKFQQVGNIVGAVSGVLGGVPLVGNILQTATKMASIFFNKQDEIVMNNMTKRIEGYLTQDQISQDIANSVLLLIENQSIQQRVLKYHSPKDTSSLSTFFGLMSKFASYSDVLAEKFTSELLGVKKEKDDNDGITENVLTDSSLIIWAMVENHPELTRKPMTCSVEILIQNIGQPQGGISSQPLSQSSISSVKTSKYFKLRVLKAKIDINTDIIGKMDPYCIVKYGKKTFKTQIHSGGHQSPVWNAEFLFQTSKAPVPLHFEVYEEDISSDDFLGSAILTDFQISGLEQKIQLSIKDKKTGILFIQLIE